MSNEKETALNPRSVTSENGNVGSKRRFSFALALLALTGVICGPFGGTMVSFVKDDIKSYLLGTQSAHSATTKPFHWKHCDYERDPRYFCGYLEVPLDYKNVSDTRKVRLSTTLFKAHDVKSNRTLIVNPGKCMFCNILSQYIDHVNCE